MFRDQWIPQATILGRSRFSLAEATGSVIWSLEGHPNYQLKGGFWLDYNSKRGQYCVSVYGSEVDDGPEIRAKIFFPTNIKWRKSKRILRSSNVQGQGIGYILKFPLPNDCGCLYRVQFVFSTKHVAFDRCLDEAFTAANMNNNPTIIAD
jgi:hypothetical protein